jgi:hypothetical protein
MAGDIVPEVIRLLDALGETGIEASLFTTYNAYLPFYEDVVLRRLLSGGCRHNSVLMDSGQLAACIGSAALRPTCAGYDYTLASIRSTAAFHPKLMLLVGPKRAITCVGSHNLTLSGFGLNREVTGRMNWSGVGDDRGTDVARAAWRATKDWLQSGGIALPRQTHKNILAMEDVAPWLRDTDKGGGDCRLLHQAPSTESLWEQLRKLTSAGVKRITIVGAFFDARCEFVHKLETAFPTAKLLVAIDPDTVQLTRKGANRIHGSWRDASTFADRSGYLHAKVLYFDTGGRSDVLALGSANPSAQGWGLGHSERNEELIAVWTGGKAREYAEQLGLGDIRDLPEVDAEAFQRIDSAAAARHDNVSVDSGVNTVAAMTPEGIEIPAEGLGGEAQSLDALDDRCEVVSANLKCTVESGLVRAPLAQDIAGAVRFVRVAFKDGGSALLTCHHCERREAATRTNRQTQLRQALANLESDPSNLATLIAAVQKVVFGPDASNTIQSAAALRPGGAGKTRESETVTSLEGTADAADRRRSRPRLVIWEICCKF